MVALLLLWLCCRPALWIGIGLKVQTAGKGDTTPPDPGTDTAGYDTGMDWPFTYAD